MDGTLTVGDAVHSVVASYVEDTPARLLDASRVACLGGQADVAWLREPEADVWRLARQNYAIRLTLDQATAWPRVGWEPGENAVVYLISPMRWLRAVLRAMSILGEDPDRYLADWRRPFPSASVQAVRALLAEERAGG